MKKLSITIAGSLVCLFFLAAFKFGNDPLKIGSALPKGDILMKDINGKQVSMNSETGKKGLLVMFSCNTCPYVIKNQERTKAICSYAIQNDIGVVLINSNEANRNYEDSPESMRQYAATQGYQWKYVIDKDSEVANAFGASRTPECFLFNKDLKLVYHGAIDDNPSQARGVKREHLKEAINEMISGKPVSVNATRSVGCSIKR